MEDQPEEIIPKFVKCPTCHGSGSIFGMWENKPCPTCNGIGMIKLYDPG